MRAARCASGVLAIVATACGREPATGPEGTAPVGAPTYTLATLEPVDAHIVVFTTEGVVPAGLGDLVASLGGVVGNLMVEPGVASVYGLTDAAAAVVRSLDGVESVTRDRKLDWLPPLKIGDTLSAQHEPHDPSTIPWWFRQWGLRVIEADKAWATGVTGVDGVRVAILDTGIDYDHRELRGVVDTSLSRSFIADDPVLPIDHPVMDLHFHGTHVAGIVAAQAFRISGVSPHITLVGVKVLSFRGRGTFEGVMSGIHYAGTIPVDVINMSLGALVPRDDPEIKELVKALDRTIRFAERRGAIVISAAGNSARDLNDKSIMSTPCEQSTLCVSATGPLLQQNFDQPAWYTNFGKFAVDVAAPGGNFDPEGDNDQVEDLVISACSRRAMTGTLVVCQTPGFVWYVWAAGTSMAAPHVSGVAALVDSKHGGALNASQLKGQIVNGAEDLGVPGTDDFYGHGRVNALRTVLP